MCFNGFSYVDIFFLLQTFSNITDMVIVDGQLF